MGKYQSIDLDTKISQLVNLCEKNYDIDPALYQKYDVKRGLRDINGQGVRAGLTNISNVSATAIVDGESVPARGKLYYRGIDVEQIVKGFSEENRFGFEETVYLLLLGDLPNRQELDAFTRHLSACRPLPENFVVDMILKAPSNNIMNKMARSVLALYSYDAECETKSIENELRTAISLVAKLPVIMASAYQVKRSHFDGESMIMHPLRPEENTAQTVLSLLRNDRQYTDAEAHLLDTLMTLHAEHGGGNNSTFTCRVLTSSGTDAYSAYAAAIGALKGPRHGGANIKVMQMLDSFKENVKNWEDEGQVADHMRKILRKEAGDGSGLIYGMGHAVYTLSDPREVILKRKAMELAHGKDIEAEFRLLDTIERLTPEIFRDFKASDKAICANVDMYSGLVYKMLGIPADLYTPMFAISRIAGWAAHRMEETITGKRIIRPAYKAIAKERAYVPLDDRD